jgi:hypothetical protein
MNTVLMTQATREDGEGEEKYKLASGVFVP